MLECSSFYIIRPHNHPLFTLQLRFLSIMLYTRPLEIEMPFYTILSRKYSVFFEKFECLQRVPLNFFVVLRQNGC